MESRTTTPLVSLKSGDVDLADPNEDIRGRRVVDREGQEVGKVDDLFVDPTERRARFMAVKSGDVLGLGGKTYLVPVDVIQSVDEEQVVINETRDRILGGPQVEGGAERVAAGGQPRGATGATGEAARAPGEAPGAAGEAARAPRDVPGTVPAAADEPALVVAVYEWYGIQQPYWSPDYRRQPWA